MAMAQPARAHLSVHFAVVGASISGLASALALSRAGHRVTVLEQAGEHEPRPTGGLRVPPNVSKVFARWGLGAELAKIAVRSRMMRSYSYAEGSYIGFSQWDEALLRECGGDFLIAAYSDVCALLLAAARAQGAVVRYGVRVEAVDEQKAHVMLAGGEVVEADVVVGVDGMKGLLRKVVLEEDAEDEDESEQAGYVLFNLAIPLEKIEADPAMQELIVDDRLSLWMGDGCSANGYPLRANEIYALHVFAPSHVAPGAPSRWGAPAVSPAMLLSGLGPTAEPRLHTLASLATPSSISAVRFPSLALAGDDDDEWMLPCTPGVILGDAAHPPVPASLQAPAMALEDAAVLAKLFSHLRRREQIPSLLGALATLRAARARQVLGGDAVNLAFTMLRYGADGAAEARDASMRALAKAGRPVGDDPEDPVTKEQWKHIITTWAYDAEDDADDWWASWGVIGERGQEDPKALAFDFGAGIVDVTAVEESVMEEKL